MVGGVLHHSLWNCIIFPRSRDLSAFFHVTASSPSYFLQMFRWILSPYSVLDINSLRPANLLHGPVIIPIKISLNLGKYVFERFYKKNYTKWIEILWIRLCRNIGTITSKAQNSKILAFAFSYKIFEATKFGCITYS